MTDSGEGGFLPPMPLSPPASSSSRQTAVLPVPRRAPLQPGSSKESLLINHVDARLLDISGKIERKFDVEVDQKKKKKSNTSQQSASSFSIPKGYADFGQLATDLDSVIDVVWISGTPLVQIPYLLSISLNLVDWLQSFPFSPQSLFPLLHKIDLAFASLITGTNAETKQPLPDGGARRLSMTEKVRLRSIVESTRIAVVDASRKDVSVASDAMGDTTEQDTTTYETDADMNDPLSSGRDWSDWDMETARVYELTIGELGQTLDSGPA